ncbi:MAG: glycosyltransferase [Methanobrevibacter sp.]|jgi:glycosyltransferase involved in cell wall biosynthesis|nr:glycosyltransferase [Candidatus Methanovirga meridionalis]
MNDIKISVIIPVYNKEKYLGECLDSIFNQTLKDIEIICVNDGSTDNSFEILKEYKKKDDRIKIFKQLNLGAGIARNTGLMISQGKYISFIDADDCFIENNALELMFNSGEATNSNMVSANIKHLINDKLEDCEFINYIDSEVVISPNSYGIPWYFYKNIFRRKFLLENHISFPNYKRGEDPVFLANILSKIDYIATIPIDYYGYRLSDNERKLYSHIMDYFQHFIDVFKILDDLKFYQVHHEYYKEFIKFIKYFVPKNYMNTILNEYEHDFLLFKFIQSTFELILNEYEHIWLSEENERIKYENKKIKDENKKIKDENKKIKDENKKIKYENKKIKDENKKIKEKNIKLKNRENEK